MWLEDKQIAEHGDEGQGDRMMLAKRCGFFICIYLFFCLFVCLFICLAVCLFVGLSSSLFVVCVLFFSCLFMIICLHVL